jgi:hypothetical protein
MADIISRLLMQQFDDLLSNITGESETTPGAGTAKENGGSEGKYPSLIPSMSSYCFPQNSDTLPPVQAHTWLFASSINSPFLAL